MIIFKEKIHDGSQFWRVITDPVALALRQNITHSGSPEWGQTI